MIAALTPHETVNLLVDDRGNRAGSARALQFASAANIRFHHIQTVDSWIRDYGPNFLIGPNGEGAFNDWIFNAWGNKYEELKKDDSIPRRLETILKLPRFSPGIVMEGGSIEVNGAGCVLTTEQCLLNPNRNPQLDRTEIEQYLKDYLGVTKVLWLGEGIVGDDTDGHIDDIARFVAPNVIVCAVEDDPGRRKLRNPARQSRAAQIDDRRRRTSFRDRHLTDAGRRRWNEHRHSRSRSPTGQLRKLLHRQQRRAAPVFGHANDARAVETLQQVFPDRRVVPINCEPLVWGMGTIHCVTQQQPQISPI